MKLNISDRYDSSDIGLCDTQDLTPWFSYSEAVYAFQRSEDGFGHLLLASVAEEV